MDLNNNCKLIILLYTNLCNSIIEKYEKYSTDRFWK